MVGGLTPERRPRGTRPNEVKLQLGVVAAVVEAILDNKSTITTLSRVWAARSRRRPDAVRVKRKDTVDLLPEGLCRRLHSARRRIDDLLPCDHCDIPGMLRRPMAV